MKDFYSFLCPCDSLVHLLTWPLGLHFPASWVATQLEDYIALLWVFQSKQHREGRNCATVRKGASQLQSSFLEKTTPLIFQNSQWSLIIVKLKRPFVDSSLQTRYELRKVGRLAKPADSAILGKESSWALQIRKSSSSAGPFPGNLVMMSSILKGGVLLEMQTEKCMWERGFFPAFRTGKVPMFIDN